MEGKKSKSTFIIGGSALLLLGLAVAAGLTLARDAKAATKKQAVIVRLLDEQTQLASRWSEKTAKLHAKQVIALDAIREQEPLHENEVQLTCEDLLPKHRIGVGILQVASVSEERDKAAEFGDFQVKRLKNLLSDRGVLQWSQHLSHYAGQGKEPVRRVIFNNVAPQAGADMCAWLRCERWTGGCAFIDEEGQEELDNPPPHTEPKFYEQAEDLYMNWHLAALNR